MGSFFFTRCGRLKYSSGITISGKDFELIAIDNEVDVMRVTGSVDGNRMAGAYYNFYEGIAGIFTGTKM